MRKGDMRVICGIVMLAVLLGLTIPSQAQSYTVWGQVFDEDGITPVDGANVTVTDINTGDSISTTTAGGGYYQVVFSPPATDPVSIGDTLQISAIYDGKINITTVSATGSPQKVDLILVMILPHVDISTDKFIYYPGDTMNITINISNPTDKTIIFKRFIGIPQYRYWKLVEEKEIAAGTSTIMHRKLSIKKWGDVPFGAVWYVHLKDPNTKEVLSADSTCWAFSPKTKNT